MTTGLALSSAAVIGRCRVNRPSCWTPNVRIRLCRVMVAALITISTTAVSAQTPGREPNGIVYFAGTVRVIIQGAAVVDVGDVHKLKAGDVLAVFRTTDSYFRPLGTIRIAESHPNWMHATRASSSLVRKGDVVMFVRTVAEIGQPRHYLDQYIATQNLKSVGRNKYSTFNQRSVALALRDIEKRQPIWVRQDRRISGLVTGNSLDGSAESRLQYLEHQINQIRGLEGQGVRAPAAAGPRWQSVMSVLRGPSIEEYNDETTLTQVDDSVITADDDEIELLPIAEIRSVVHRLLFDRPEEERDTLSVIVTAMLRLDVGDENLWVRRQLMESQFPVLANDDQIYFDVDKIMRLLRNTD
jgi:hypothetical protein